MSIYEKECLVCGHRVVARTPVSRWLKFLPHAVIKLSNAHKLGYREWRRGLSDATRNDGGAA